MQFDNDFEKEVREIFLDQFIHQGSEVQECVEMLKDSQQYQEAVNNLFRIFHGLKANSNFFHYEELAKLSVKVEAVLNALRDINPPIAEGVLKWLQDVAEQYAQWVEELGRGDQKLLLQDKKLTAKIMISDLDNVNPMHLLKEKTLYYFHHRETISPKLVALLAKFTAGVVHISNIREFEETMKTKNVELCIIDADKGFLEAARIFHRYSITGALIVFLDKVDAKTRMKLRVQGIYHTLNYPLRVSELQRELLTVVESHFTSRRIVIDNTKIEDFILGLQAFPDAINRIQRVCNDSESSIKDLVQEVKKDPVISGIVLQEVQNPLYNLSDINTVDKAVALLGKKYVHAIAMKKVLDNFDLKDLDLYRMPFESFSNVATKRYMLMIKWYSKVSIGALEMLSTTAMLGNIGQLLIAKEIKRIGKEEEFRTLMHNYCIEYAEQKIVHTTTARVSGDIFRYWNLHRDIVDSVRFSDNSQYAPMEVYDLALANYIVFRLIPLNGEIVSEIPEKIKQLLLDQGMNIDVLQKALDSVIELTK